MTAQEKITKARAGLILDQVFFGSLALRLALKEDPGCKTAWTDGVTLGYEPEFINELSLDQCKGLIAHEVMHIAAAHNVRRGERDKDRWNVAGDYAINDILIASGIIIPDNALTGVGTDKSAEEIYSTLPEPKQDRADQGQTKQGQKSLAPDQTGQNGKGQGQDKAKQQGNDPGGCGEVRDYPWEKGKATPAEKSRVEQEIKIAVSQAAQQGKAAGNLPGGLDRMVEDMLNPIIDWREALRRFVQTNAKNDYSWTPPNRRFVHMGLYFPSLRSEELGDIVVALDTSGSITARALSQFAAEASSILEEYDTTATVIYCDREIKKIETFSKNDLPLELHPIGGGGTDFRPPFDWIDKQGLMPACLIYLTDLRCSYFPAEPNYPVLWAQLGSTTQQPPFGDVIKVA